VEEKENDVVHIRDAFTGDSTDGKQIMVNGDRKSRF